jgi:hypothetical protein
MMMTVRDTLDLQEVSTPRMNLSTVPDIGWDDHDWLLVDSADKMKQCIQELEVRS